MRIAKAAVATSSDNCFFTVASKVSYYLSISFDTRADGNIDNKVLARTTSGASTGAVFAILGGEDRSETKVY